MYSKQFLKLLSMLLVASFSPLTIAAADPFLWLEEVEGKQPMAWVAQHNKDSLAEIKSYPGFQQLADNSLAILNSEERIPYARRMGKHYYNTWKDEKNPRGLYRRTSLAEYKKPEPKWETVLDIDALSKKEAVNWVFKGVNCLQPEYQRCMVSLSRGGADAVELREFDLPRAKFIEAGFFVAEAKNRFHWLDQDNVLVGTDFADGHSMTDSGYPRVIKLWQRGQALSAAQSVYSASKKSVSVAAYEIAHGNNKLTLIYDGLTFYTSSSYAYSNGKLTQLSIPADADILGMFKSHVYLQLKSSWQPADTLFKQGSVVSIAKADLLLGKKSYRLFVEPTARKSIDDLSFSKDAILVSWLDNVRSKVSRYTPAPNGDWSIKNLEFSDKGNLSVFDISDQYSDFFVNYSSFTEPSSLYWVDGQSLTAEKIKSLPHMFAGDDFKAQQFMASSKDGTQVPYFVVMAKNTQLDGKNPTLLYGYGGFEISLRPRYSATVGKNWLEQGGVYVLANIRGGGEFGPSWHQAALKQNRHKAYEDFEAIAEDLIARKITSSKHLGIQGGSNGGLLMGNAFTRRPDLYNAVVCQVPLLDMQRYNKLLAGASWMGEYGNPDLPEEWAFIKTFSPYHMVQKDVSYPKVFFTTSTRDDRVHPGHARKMVALMESLGHEVLYYENIEGGHAGAADNKQRAELSALAYAYLLKQLK